jgi:predicted RNase H-like HicB family nuclease
MSYTGKDIDELMARTKEAIELYLETEKDIYERKPY